MDATSPKQTVFLYPGQGSQHLGMGVNLYQAYPEAREKFHLADRLLGFSLSRLCFEGPAEALGEDLNAQLAVYTVSAVLTDLLKSGGILPDALSGYSSGFYAAAYAAGSFDFEEGLEIVRSAGEILLDESVGMEGGLSVLFGLSAEEAEGLCTRVTGAWVAIRNTPRQTVVSGTRSALREIMARARDQGALDAYPIPSACPYHSPLMEQAGGRFLDVLRARVLRPPQVPLISYLTLEPVTNEESLREVLAMQLSRPVFWVELVRLLGEGADPLFVEVGPGSVIARTVRWIRREARVVASEGLLSPHGTSRAGSLLRHTRRTSIHGRPDPS